MSLFSELHKLSGDIYYMSVRSQLKKNNNNLRFHAVIYYAVIYYLIFNLLH